MPGEVGTPDLQVGAQIEEQMMRSEEVDRHVDAHVEVEIHRIEVGLPGNDEVGAGVEPGLYVAAFIGRVVMTARHQGRGREREVEFAFDHELGGHLPAVTQPGHLRIMVWRFEAGMIPPERQHEVAGVLRRIEPGVKGEAAAQMAILGKQERLFGQLGPHAQEAFLRAEGSRQGHFHKD